MLALSMVPLLGVVALAVDVGMLFRQRRNAQNAADAAALAYAHERFRGATTTTADAALFAQSDTNGFRNGQGRVHVTSNVIAWGGTSNAIKVEVIDTVPTLFGRVLGRTSAGIYASAVATYDLALSTSCIYSLDPSAAGAVDIDNNGDITASGCGLMVNSNSPSALRLSNNADLVVSRVGVTGGVSNSGSITGTISTGIAPSPNPAAAVPSPTPASPCTVNYVLNNNGVDTINPGTYCSIRVKNNGVLTMNAGTYMITGGNFQVENGGRVNSASAGITIALLANSSGTYGTLDVSNNAILTLAAPTTGTYSGILFYKPATAPATPTPVTLSNNAGGSLLGAFYMPSQTLNVENNATLTITGALVTARITIAQNGHLIVPAPTPSTGAYFPIKRPTLVE